MVPSGDVRLWLGLIRQVVANEHSQAPGGVKHVLHRTLSAQPTNTFDVT